MQPHPLNMEPAPLPRKLRGTGRRRGPGRSGEGFPHPEAPAKPASKDEETLPRRLPPRPRPSRLASLAPQDEGEEGTFLHSIAADRQEPRADGCLAPAAAYGKPRGPTARSEPGPKPNVQRHADRQLRQLHLQPRPLPRRVGRDVTVQRNDEISGRRSARRQAGRHRAVAWPLHAERSRHLPRADRAPRRTTCRFSASASAIRRSARRSAATSCARRADAWQDRDDPAPAARRLSRHRRAVSGDALSFADRRARDPARSSRSPRRPPTASSWALRTRRLPTWRAVPSREHRLASTATKFCSNFLDLARRMEPRAALTPMRVLSVEARTWSVQASDCRLAAGATLARDEAERRFRLMLSGEATPAQIGGFLMALRVRGETRRRNHRRGAAMRARDAPRRGAAGRDRHRRHRRRRLRHAQCLDARRDHRRGLRRSGRQAWQSRRVLAIGRGGRARRARRQDWP